MAALVCYSDSRQAVCGRALLCDPSQRSPAQEAVQEKKVRGVSDFSDNWDFRRCGDEKLQKSSTMIRTSIKHTKSTHRVLMCPRSTKSGACSVNMTLEIETWKSKKNSVHFQQSSSQSCAKQFSSFSILLCPQAMQRCSPKIAASVIRI